MNIWFAEILLKMGRLTSYKKQIQIHFFFAHAGSSHDENIHFQLTESTQERIDREEKKKYKFKRLIKSWLEFSI